MRLVIDGHRLTAERTGVGRCLEGLLDDWAGTGWPLPDTRLVLRDPGGLARVPRSPGLSATVLGPAWPGLAWDAFALGRFLRPDDVLFAPANLIPPDWYGRTLLLVHDTLLWSAPGSFPWHARLRFGIRYRLAARRATRLVVASESTARDVERFHGVPRDRLTVAYQGAGAAFRPVGPASDEIIEARRLLGPGDAPYFLFVGKRSARRHVPALLAAFRAHRLERPGDRLVFVGPGGSEGLPGPGSGVLALGHVSEPALVGLLAGALALLYPSDYEGFGLPVVEAMACGCPVVTLRNSALVETAGDAAYVLDAPAVEALARALADLAGDEALRRKLSERGRAQAGRFSAAGFAATLKSEIRRVAGQT